jgi:hypothetical protein
MRFIDLVVLSPCFPLGFAIWKEQPTKYWDMTSVFSRITTIVLFDTVRLEEVDMNAL